MITLRLPARVFLCLAPTDMRKSFDGLASVVASTCPRPNCDRIPYRIRAVTNWASERPNSRIIAQTGEEVYDVAGQAMKWKHGVAMPVDQWEELAC